MVMTAASRAGTEHTRRVYDRLAGEYDDYVGYAETYLLGDGRHWICSQAVGDVLEIGVGTGRNLSYYPDDVRLTGVDLSPTMLDIARLRAADLSRDVDLYLGDGQALDFPACRFDTVVATLALSSIPDERHAVAEARRVLRPGGRFIVLDFVRSPHLGVRTIQRLLGPYLVRRYAFHPHRQPLDALAAEGFIIEKLERLRWGIVECVSGRKPALASPCSAI
jgi:ubiquinone/menaquinone biosynthesis C-methylase UbiE